MKKIFHMVIFLFVITATNRMVGKQLDNIITIGGDHNYPPYEFIDDQGNANGFNIEIIEAIADQIGARIDVRLDSWHQILEQLETGEVDAITGMVYSMERARRYSFSRPHNHLDIALVVRDDNNSLYSIEELSGKEIIVQQDDVMHEYALRHNLTDQLITVDNQIEAVQLLSSGSYDALLMPKTLFLYYAQKEDVKNLKVIPDVLFVLEYCFASLPENGGLINRLNQGLLAIRESGKYEIIYDRWFSDYEDDPLQWEDVFQYALIVLIIATIIFFIILIWTISLRAKVKLRTKDLFNELKAHEATSLELTKNRNRYQYLLENLSEVVFEADDTGTILFITKNVINMLGYKSEELIDKCKLYDLIILEDHDKLEQYFSALKQEKGLAVKLVGLNRDGRNVYIKIFANNVIIGRSDQANPNLYNYSLSDQIDSNEVGESRITGIIVDVTAQHHHESIQKALYDISEATQSTEDTGQLFSKIHAIIGSLMPVQNMYIALYDETSEMLSFPFFEAEKDERPQPKKLGKGMTEYVLKNGEALLVNRDMLEKLSNEGKAEILGKPAAIWLGVPLKINNKVVGVLVVQDYEDENTYDNTDKQILTFVSEQIAAAIYRKQFQEICARQTTYYKKLFDHIPAGVVLVDNNNNVRDVNSKFIEMFGYDYHEVIGSNINLLIAPGSLTSEAESLSKKTQQGEIVRIETLRRTKADKLINVSLFGVPVHMEGDIEDIYGIYFDTTELHQAQASLAAEKEKLSVMLSSIGDGVIATDNTGNVILVNGVACELTGWKESEAIDTQIDQVFKIMNETTRESVDSIVRKVIETETVVFLSNHTVLQSKDGIEYIIEDSAAPIKDRDGYLVGVILVFRDVTEKRKLEYELQKNAKLESIGILAGGIAHDFNNILTSIIGNLSLARKISEKSSDIKIDQRLKEAEKASFRAKRLTQQLLTFSTGGEPVKKTASVKEIIQDTATFATHGSNIHKTFNIQKGLWNVESDTGQISQVINNLTINAVQAMPEGGELSIGAKNKKVKELIYKSIKPGNYVVISFSDTGCGMTTDQLKKIFDPFFTTKTNGTGLGLTTSNNIIKKHGGYITVDSSLGKGTTFRIYLPATDKQIFEERQIEYEHDTRKRKVLIMDDDIGLLEIVKEMVESLGYVAVTSRDGKEAIDYYLRELRNNTKYDAVILDLTVPGGIGGKETVEKILELDPQACCIVSSGYSSAPIMADYKHYGFKAVLGKPYSFKELDHVLSFLFHEEKKSN